MLIQMIRFALFHFAHIRIAGDYRAIRIRFEYYLVQLPAESVDQYVVFTRA